MLIGMPDWQTVGLGIRSGQREEAMKTQLKSAAAFLVVVDLWVSGKTVKTKAGTENLIIVAP